MKRFLFFAAIIALIAAQSGCNRDGRDGSSRRVGVTMGDGSVPEIVYRSCPGELVASVEIKQFVQGKPEAETRWKIKAGGEPVSFEPVPLGETPPGFEEVVPLKALPAGSTQFITILETELDGENLKTSANFVPDDLKGGQVMTSAFDSVPVSEFEDQSSCPGG